MPRVEDRFFLSLYVYIVQNYLERFSAQALHKTKAVDIATAACLAFITMLIALPEFNVHIQPNQNLPEVCCFHYPRSAVNNAVDLGKQLHRRGQEQVLQFRLLDISIWKFISMAQLLLNVQATSVSNNTLI